MPEITITCDRDTLIEHQTRVFNRLVAAEEANPDSHSLKRLHTALDLLQAYLIDSGPGGVQPMSGGDKPPPPGP